MKSKLSLFFCLCVAVSFVSCHSIEKRTGPSSEPVGTAEACAPEQVRWPAGDQEWNLYQKVFSFSFTTDYYIKTTGVSGFFFGRFSQADENEVLKQIQHILAKELRKQGDIDLNLVQLLPPTIENSHVRTVDSKSETEKGFFGTEKVDRYEKYEVHYTMRVRVLYPGRIDVGEYENKGLVNPAIRVEYMNKGQWELLGKLSALDPNLLSLGAVDLSDPTNEVAKVSISDVHKKYRYELGSYLAKSLPNGKRILLSEGTEIRVVMDFLDEDGKVVSSQILESTERFEDKNRVLKELGVKGFRRYFDTFFYLHHFKQFRNKVFGGVNKCHGIYN